MKRFAPLLLVGSLIALATAAQAHHGLTQQFDVEKQVTVSGTVSKVDWINPHIYFVLDVKPATGATQQYLLETVPVAFARRAGITKDMLLGGGKPVEVTLFPGRKDPHLGFARLIKFSDGRTLQLRGDR
ncbi:MAG: DUF6152 family protein [Caulobacteraceae bacterium]